MQAAIDRIMDNLQILRDKGLPSPLVINKQLMTHEDYNNKIRELEK